MQKEAKVSNLKNILKNSTVTAIENKKCAKIIQQFGGDKKEDQAEQKTQCRKLFLKGLSDKKGQYFEEKQEHVFGGKITPKNW